MKRNIFEFLFFMFFMIANLFIAYSITTSLNIKDIILFQSYTASNYVITYEVLIWFTLDIIEACIYEKLVQKKSEAF